MYNIKHVLINLFVIGKALVNRILVIVLGESKSYMQIFDCVWGAPLTRELFKGQLCFSTLS